MVHRRTWFLVAGLVAVLAYQWTPDTWVQTLAYDTIGFAGVAAMGVGLFLHRPAHRLPWWLLLAGQCCYVGGDLVAAVMRRWLGLEPFPAPADYLYLVGYALQAVALLMIIRRRPRGGDGAALLEASIIGAAFALVSWVFLMKPVVLDTELTFAGKLISVGFPALDLLNGDLNLEPPGQPQGFQHVIGVQPRCIGDEGDLDTARLGPFEQIQETFQRLEV